MTTVLSAILQRKYFLLDFDGPICAVFSGLSSRDCSRQLASKSPIELPSDIETSRNPFDILQYLDEQEIDGSQLVNSAFTEIEIRAVYRARPNLAGHDVIYRAAQAGKKLAIVSNNSTECIDQYLKQHKLQSNISGIYARTSTDTEILKPNPHLLQQAIADFNTSTENCVFLGDSIADIRAAHSARIPVIAYANRPGKIFQFVPHNPTTIVTSMNEVLQALSDTVGA